MRGVAALLLAVIGLCVGTTAALAYVYAPTAQAAALAATKRFAAHEVKAWNQPQVSYNLGTCHVLHHRPWLAYACTFELHGVSNYCHGVVTVGVKRLAERNFRGQEVSSKYVDDHGC